MATKKKVLKSLKKPRRKFHKGSHNQEGGEGSGKASFWIPHNPNTADHLQGTSQESQQVPGAGSASTTSGSGGGAPAGAGSASTAGTTTTTTTAGTAGTAGTTSGSGSTNTSNNPDLDMLYDDGQASTGDTAGGTSGTSSSSSSSSSSGGGTTLNEKGQRLKRTATRAEQIAKGDLSAFDDPETGESNVRIAAPKKVGVDAEGKDLSTLETADDDVTTIAAQTDAKAGTATTPTDVTALTGTASQVTTDDSAIASAGKATAQKVGDLDATIAATGDDPDKATVDEITSLTQQATAATAPSDADITKAKGTAATFDEQAATATAATDGTAATVDDTVTGPIATTRTAQQIEDDALTGIITNQQTDVTQLPTYAKASAR